MLDDIAKVASNLRVDFLKIAALQVERNEILSSDRPPAMKDEDARELELLIARRTERIRRQLEEFAHFPFWHVRHAQFLDDFGKKGTFEDSVFIMTKFPDSKNPSVGDPQLERTIEAVSKAVIANNYVPRIASDKDYHAQLWDNVELHMLGCRRGIAIVQDKVKTELNPNVAIEWGWMLGLDRKVLYLVEKDFAQERADWKGMTKYEFDWSNPVPDVNVAMKKFLPARQ
jgi:hypothetical protein